VHRERVVLRRALRGIKMAVNLPVALYRGVSIRVQETATDASRTITLVLEHPDPDLSVTLCRAPDASEIIAEWQSWGRALGLPLLVEGPHGCLRQPFECIGNVRVGIPIARRRRHGALHGRRATTPLRRAHGLPAPMPSIHTHEREIIARN